MRTCPNIAVTKEFACEDYDQCFEPCGKLGHDAKYAIVHVPTPEEQVTPADVLTPEVRRWAWELNDEA